MSIVPFGEFAPDRPTVAKGQLRMAKNVLPAALSFRPLPALVELTDPTTNRPLGAASFRDIAGAVHTYTGDSTKLYELSTAGAWTDRSRGAGYGPATDSTRWRFAQYGDRVFATNLIDEVQFIDASSGSAFANLAGSPPKAAYVAAFQNFVILANLSTSAFKVRWSEIGNSEGWSTSSNQGGEEEFTDGGQITGIAVTDAVYIFQEFCIRRMVYVGGPTVFQFDVIERGRGCIAPGSLVQVGRAIFYQAESGFFLFDGESSTPIGVERVDQFYKDDLERASIARVTGDADPIQRVVVWAYPSIDSVDAAPDTLLIYHWGIDRWSYGKANIEVLFSRLSAGTTLEELDAIYGDLDSIPISLDDPSLAGGALTLGVMTGTKALASFSGTAMEATFITDDLIIGEDQMMKVRGVRPLINGDCYVKIGTRRRLSDAVSYGSEIQITADGWTPQRATGRYARVQARVPAATTWTRAEGFEFDAVPVGRR